MLDQPAHGPASSASEPAGGGAGRPGNPDERVAAGWIATREHGVRPSDFGKFDWFAEAENFGPGWSASPRGHACGRARGDASGPRQDPGKRRRRRTDGADPVVPRDSGGRANWLRGWRFLGVLAGASLVSSAAGGAVGGFVAVRMVGSQSDPSYSVGLGPPSTASTQPSTVAAVAARDAPAVVMIKVNGSAGTGSGFVIQGGYIVTNNHVVTLDGLVSNASIRVYFSDGKSAAARLVGRDPYSDIAVIKPTGATGATGLPALALGNSGSVAVGDPVIAFGSPLGLAGTVTSGIVSALNRPIQPGNATGLAPQACFDAIQTDAPINPGNSGGPLVNARGQVIGVDAAIDTLGNPPITGAPGGSIGIGFAIPVDQARRVIVELIRTGHATHSVLGATLKENYGGTGAQLAAARRPDPAVVPGGPAARAGLRPGDVITKLGGRPIASAGALLAAVGSLPPGSTVGVTFTRRGRPMRTRITLGSARS